MKEHDIKKEKEIEAWVQNIIDEGEKENKAEELALEEAQRAFWIKIANGIILFASILIAVIILLLFMGHC